MTSKVQAQAHDLRPGDTSYQRGTVTTAERVQIPADMKGRFCVFVATTEAVWVRFGNGSVAVDEGAGGDSGLAAEVLTADANTAMLYVPAGGERHRRLPSAGSANEYTHMSHKSSATGGKLIFGNATGEGAAED